MLQGHLRSIYKPFVKSLIRPKFTHTSCRPVTESFVLLHYNEEYLSSRLALLLRADVDFSILKQGRQVHSRLIVNGISSVGHLGARILAMYVLCGSFSDAKKIFYKLELWCTTPWNWMIRGLVKMGWSDFALLFYFKMLSCRVCPDKYTFPCVIKACSGLNNLRLVKLIHDTIRFMELETDAFVGSSLIKCYADEGYIGDARILFDKMSEKDQVLCNVMLNGYVKSGDIGNAAGVFKEMRISQIMPGSATFACLLSLCASEAIISLGTQLHGLIVIFGSEFVSPVANTLLAMYSKCGQLSDARKIFDSIPRADLVTWNGMISGYVQNGFMEEASRLFREMVFGVRVRKPDSITFSSFLPAVTELASLKLGKEIHGYIVRHGVTQDVFLKSALIDIYFKCRDMEMAQKVFNQCTSIDIVVCTAMISGYVFNGMNSAALDIFRWLLQEKMIPNAVTLASILPACSGLVALRLGKELHANILKRGLDRRSHVGTAIMDMFAKSGRLDLARRIFERISERDTICWNSMITSCCQNSKPEEAIDLFRQMRTSGMKNDCVSISAALSACSNLPAQHYGKEIHAFMIKGSLSSDVFAESALIDMYAKCGNLDCARRVFDTMRDKTEVSWNSIIAAYGNHGHLRDSLSLFHRMLDDGFQPDHVTFLAIISACSHVGGVDDGIYYFRSMTKDYRIQPQMEHYACMVDLFGRAGHVEEAFKTIKSMPFSPDAGVWGTLLGACRVHGNVELARIASRKLFELDPQNSGYYVLLSNIHADAGEWGNVLEIRSLMRERGVQKIPGYSWIEVNNTTHLFVAADGSHPESLQIYSVLKLLLLELKREGYVPQTYLPMHLRREGVLSSDTNPTSYASLACPK